MHPFSRPLHCAMKGGGRQSAGRRRRRRRRRRRSFLAKRRRQSFPFFPPLSFGPFVTFMSLRFEAEGDREWPLCRTTPSPPRAFQAKGYFFLPLPKKSLLRCHCMMSPNSGQCLANPRQDLKCVCPSSSLNAMGAKGCTERVRADRERQGNMGVVLLPSRPAVFFSGVDSAREKRRRTLADGPSCVFLPASSSSSFFTPHRITRR